MSGDSYDDASGDNGYGISGKVQYVTASGEEPALEKLGHACENQTAGQGQCLGIFSDKGVGHGVSA